MYLKKINTIYILKNAYSRSPKSTLYTVGKLTFWLNHKDACPLVLRYTVGQLTKVNILYGNFEMYSSFMCITLFEL